MQQTGDYITKEKRKTLEIELEDLKGPKRKEILVSLEYAKSLGDLSENAEYHQTREDQGKLEERIAKIEQILESSQIFSSNGGDLVEVGSIVVVQKAPTPKGVGEPAESLGEEKTFMIVGSEEADMVTGKISNKSPFGVALFGKKKGESVSFMTPNGIVYYKILSVS
ncbi:transcription elongation factor GreA [Candidatus Nomurabacteria bacterium]|nr:transcription elongation factor GreA [Candidatus Nomurabacteria bacterium]